MAKLIGLLGALSAIAIGVGVFFWRKKSKSWDSMWDEAKDSTSEWAKTASSEAHKTADKIVGASDDATKKAADVAKDVNAGVRSS